jgi:hypothetical protein
VLVSELLSFVCNRGCCSSSFYKPLASVFIFQNVEYVLSQIIPLVGLFLSWLDYQALLNIITKIK